MDDKREITLKIISSLNTYYEWINTPNKGKTIHETQISRDELNRYYAEFCELVMKYAPEESQYHETAERLIKNTNTEDITKLFASTQGLFLLLEGLVAAYNRGAFDIPNPPGKEERERPCTPVRFHQIFVSHSKEDTNFKEFFIRGFFGTTVKSVFEEYEEIIRRKVSVNKIKHDIDTSDAVFFLLSKNLERVQFARDWIAFGAGYASAKGKDIWVFEPAEKFGKLTFIIPGLSHIMPIYLDGRHVAYLHGIIDSYKKEDASKFCPQGIPVKCENCYSKYSVHQVPPGNFRCPVCHENIYLGEEKETVKQVRYLQRLRKH